MFAPIKHVRSIKIMIRKVKLFKKIIITRYALYVYYLLFAKSLIDKSLINDIDTDKQSCSINCIILTHPNDTLVFIQQNRK